ncbi:hypothetical protein P170DRAFT_464388 [Aspergillus steynii IBT 23096]|uniref:Uncharacterized protein n=1 Tax=Aspergillus steynii IBT 23096 TaxID=1392250 RepID=A0A2I2G7A6_9EURO|nr:uncharacterized protein P170DRAFT_464388 [Aspergillus steynii IBT 23096]PLB48741.1 hypothetical protein P170DRAFT_464388 [Aspergillus steynii IBT 23096]
MASEYEFEIGLDEGGEESGYHMFNAPGQEQRAHLINQTYPRDRIVKGDLEQVIHGHLTPDGDEATLIVAKFSFLGQTPDRRFKYARITWDFSYEGSLNSPEVLDISLDGQFIMNKSTFSSNNGYNADLGVQGGVGVTGSVGAGWTRSLEVTVNDHVSIYGTSRYRDQKVGEPDSARWVLEENASQKSGIPGLIRTAVLLRRQPGKLFLGDIEIQAKIGFGNNVMSWFGRKQGVHPVVFNPALPPTTKVYDPSNLESVVLDDIQSVVHNKVLPTTE